MLYFSATTLGFYDSNINGDIPVDAVPISSDQHQLLLAGQAAGKIIAADATGRPTLIDPPPPTPEQTLQSYEAAIEGRLDQFAQSRGYRHGDRLASYKGSSNATWAAEADRFIGLREATWTKFISISDDIKSGKRTMPELDELLAELPALTWTN